MSYGKCQVCKKNDAIGVASGACGPISFAYCSECLLSGAQPFAYLTAYLGCGGVVSADALDPDFLPVIDATCKTAGKTLDEFWATCASVLADVNNMGE